MAGFGYLPQSAFYPVQTTMQSYAPTYDFATALKIQSSNNSNQAFQGIIHSHVCIFSSLFLLNLRSMISSESNFTTAVLFLTNLRPRYRVIL